MKSDSNRIMTLCFSYGPENQEADMIAECEVFDNGPHEDAEVCPLRYQEDTGTIGEWTPFSDKGPGPCADHVAEDVLEQAQQRILDERIEDEGEEYDKYTHGGLDK